MASVQHYKTVIFDILEALHSGVSAEGGDGWGEWISGAFDVNDLLPLVVEFNSQLEFPWEDVKMEEDGSILWQNGQESITIENGVMCKHDFIQMRIEF